MATIMQSAAAGHAAPRVPIEWSEKAARDRLSSTLFLAALFHGIVILGVTFSAADEDAPAATSLDVVIVTSDNPRSLSAQDAVLLAEQSIQGSGNTDAPDQLRTALAQTSEAMELGPDRLGAAQPVQAGDPGASQPLLIAAAQDAEHKPLLDADGQHELQAVEQATAMPGERTAVEIVNEPDNSTLISESGPRELVISASTRESRIAAYLSNWKRRVEQFGTLNFPRQAQSRGRRGNPVLEVAITADGRLREVVVRDSSGERLLDDAAMEIVRNAAPFEAFPEFLRADYDVLRFAYEWRFGQEGFPGQATTTGGS